MRLNWLPFPMILLWLLCAGVTGQDVCSSPGDLLAPTLFLNVTSAQEGDQVLARCADLPNLPNLPITKVVFCKDGVDVSSQKLKPGLFSSTWLFKTTMKSSGSYSCGYQRKNEKNQVTNSQLSAPFQLKVTDRKAPPTVSSVTDQAVKPSPHEGGSLAIVLGIAVGAFLVLVPVTYLLVKKVASKQRHQREQGLNSTENAGTDDLIQYAAISTFGKGRRPQQQETETATYAVIGKARGRPS